MPPSFVTLTEDGRRLTPRPAYPTVHAELDTFINDTTTMQGDVDVLDKYLTEHSPSSPVRDLVPTEEVAIRLEYARKILKRIRMVDSQWEFTAMELSAVMMAPLDIFENHKHLQPHHLSDDLKRITDLIKHFLDPPVSPAAPKSAASTGASKPRRASKRKAKEDGSDDSYESEMVSINPQTGEVRRGEKDQEACILTATADPDVCHIVPFAFNSTPKNLADAQAVVKTCYWALGTQDSIELAKLVASRVGSSHKVWNIPGISVFRLQFRWMPRNQQGNQNPHRKFDLEAGGGQRMFSDLEEQPEHIRDLPEEGGCVSILRGQSGRKLFSGHTVEMEMESGKAEKMKRMIDFQWALIALNALSGAAGSPELQGGPPDADGLEMVTSWLLSTEFEALDRDEVATSSIEEEEPATSGMTMSRRYTTYVWIGGKF
ncbi:hypothetical protein QBC33DRAFT_598797 [Phialemonium atrogriseum]|uniref:HNH nuclease domain-containing protein n=1 Tax=Phialemonium atrogriseum TaxID=1093897 RepID=A0AAJ0FHC0_9PEZI|nr:uncharacterized protein QBC33DRAFT_598797 [Phialemonium atrogriseum]KAK1763243.1 hypothetical protein QBC33DRAFT_598797 [Phialemonium atrogriseum]